MSSTARLGILGGTLDPVHFGHLQAATAARAVLGLDRVLFMPSRMPPHRSEQPSASGYHRFAMVALAVSGIEGFEASDVELHAPGPSFTAETLKRLHAGGLQPSQVFFITGADAFAEIETWRQYPHVLDLSHFVVVSRPGHPAGSLRSKLPALSGRMRDGTPDAADTSNPTIFLVEAATPDVSSTEIRRRLRAGEPVHGMIPAAVETHIRQHGLYVRHRSSFEIVPTADHLHGED